MFIGLTGCQSMRDISNCSSQSYSVYPLETRQVYVRTETRCNSSGSVSPTTTRGNDYGYSGSTNCVSTPIYETVRIEDPRRDQIYNECMFKTQQQRSYQESLLTNPNKQQIRNPDNKFYQDNLKIILGTPSITNTDPNKSKNSTSDQKVLNPDGQYYQDLLKNFQGK